MQDKKKTQSLYLIRCKPEPKPAIHASCFHCQIIIWYSEIFVHVISPQNLEKKIRSSLAWATSRRSRNVQNSTPVFIFIGVCWIFILIHSTFIMIGLLNARTKAMLSKSEQNFFPKQLLTKSNHVYVNTTALQRNHVKGKQSANLHMFQGSTANGLVAVGIQ